MFHNYSGERDIDDYGVQSYDKSQRGEEPGYTEPIQFCRKHLGEKL